MKNGDGKFYYLDKGQLYEGTWLNDVPKCGTMKDFARDQAPDPTKYELPAVSILLPYVQKTRLKYSKEK